jgi:hypothetical protein
LAFFYWFDSTLVSQLREDLLLCSSYLPLGVPNELFLQAISGYCEYPRCGIMEEKGPEADVAVISVVEVPGEKDPGDTDVVVEGDDEKVVSGSDDVGWDSAISIGRDGAGWDCAIPIGRDRADEVTTIGDVYARFDSCRQCWASKCRGL